MNGMAWPASKPLLTDDEFSKVLQEDNDASIWLALVGAALNDPILNRIFALARAKGWSRFRTVMVCSYVMAQRHERMIQREMDRLNTTLPPPMQFCVKCSEDLFTSDDGGKTVRFKTSEEQKA
jgi:hypothetical protein